MKLACWALLVLSIALCTSPARAQERAIIHVTLVAAAAADALLGARITSWFDASKFEVRIARAAALDPAQVLARPSGAGVSVWVSLTSHEARLYFAMLDHARDQGVYLLREMALDGGLDELGSERIATVLHLSSVALLEGQLESERASVEASLQVQPEPVVPTPKPEPPLPLPVPPREPWRFVFGVGYGALLRGDEGPGHGPRASFEALHVKLGPALLFTSSLPHTARLRDVELRLYTLSLAPLLSVALEPTPRLGLRFYAGPSFSFVQFEPRSRSSDVALTGSQRELRTSLLAGVGLRVALGRLWLGLALECAAALQDTHYDVERASSDQVPARQREELAAPWPVTPGAALSLHF